jgi:signal transduction histidine kinase
MKRTRIFISFFIVFTLTYIPFNKIHSQDTLLTRGLQIDLEKLNDSSKVAALKDLCWEYRNKDASQALIYGFEALRLAQTSSITYEIADIYNRLGVVRRNQSKFTEALEYYLKSLEISKKHNFYMLQVYGYNNIADIYNRLEIYDKALHYVKLGLSISDKIDDKNTLGYIYNVLGQIYKNQNKLDSAYECYSKSLRYRQQIQFTSAIATSLLNIGNIHFLMGSYDSSFFYFTKSIEIYKKENDQFGLANAYRHIGLYYNSQKDYKKAITYLEKCLEFNNKYGNTLLQKEASMGLKLSYYALGNIEKAYYYQDLASKFNDSINTNIYIERITHLTENFNYELRRKEEELLRRESEALLSNKIKYQQSLIKLYISVLLLLALLVFVIFYFYQLKNKSYKLLNQQKLKIEELNSTKDKLFSIIGHDLKNPIHSIMGISQLLKDSSGSISPDTHSEMIESIYEMGQSTYLTLESLLNWAKTQTNQVHLNNEKVNIRQLVKSVISNYILTAKNKGVSIVSSIESEIYIETDPIIVSTVLRNLIANAIKYSGNGNSITISSSDSNDFFNLSVADSGVGIPEEIRKTLFSSSYNKSTYGTANEKGTGLGLIICREFLAKLGGKIWVESELGKGSTFTFAIPRNP